MSADQPAAQGRVRTWLAHEYVLETPEWCRPRFKPVAPGVSVKTTYGYHVIVALVYTLWRKVRRV